jgi:2,4-dienoyl-CoA reductase-like NADH-dependent reductase (Old Yellow Enzyme family)
MGKTPFDSATIGGIKVKNRIFRSATHESTALPGGGVSEAITDMYRDLAKGEVGLIITGYMSFSKEDNPSGSTVLIGDDSAVPGLEALTDTVHHGGSRIVTQLAHVGSQLTHPPTGAIFAPSDVVDPVNGIKPEPFSREQIQTLVKEFGDAAVRAKAAGFDGVQLHGAHGYLLSKFLSPEFNRREDEYGGTPEKNVRVAVDILKEIKARCGADYPVWIKLNCSDFLAENRGLDFEGALVAARALADAGIDAIELSGGTFASEHTPCRSRKHVAYHLEYAKRLTREIDTPVILVGGIREIDVIEKILGDTDIEAISLSRPLIREPGLVRRWKEGDRSKAACVACNGCFNPTGTVCFFTLDGGAKEAQKQRLKQLFGKK